MRALTIVALVVAFLVTPLDFRPRTRLVIVHRYEQTEGIVVTPGSTLSVDAPDHGWVVWNGTQGTIQCNIR